MNAIVINLDRRYDRLQSLLKHLQNYDIEVHRFAALEGKDSYEISDTWYNTVLGIYGKPMSDGEKGCAMSHLTIWKNINPFEYLFILEDDIRLVKEFHYLLNFYINFLPDDWHIFSLDFNHVKPAIKINDFIYKATYFYNTGAYFINYNGAKILLKYPITSPVDHYLSELAFYNKINIYTPKQQLAYQTRQDSDIIHS